MLAILLEKFTNKISYLYNGFDTSVSSRYFQTFEEEIIYFKRSKPFLETPTDKLPAKAAKSMAFYNAIEQSEYIYIIQGPAFIEPVAGWILDESKRIYSLKSFPYSELEVKPSFVNLKIQRHKVLRIDKIISIRYYFKNYWHFLNDVLGQLAYLTKSGYDTSIPILVPAGVLSIPYIKAAIERSSLLKSRTWIEQEAGVLVQANTIIVAKNLPNTRANFLNVLELLEVPPLTPAVATGRKIFVKRGANRGRRLANIEEIEAVMLAAGFEVVDNDLLSFEQQIDLYRQASHVVGIHGAGLMNLIFRVSAPLHLIELFPENIIPPHYYWLCHELGFTYNCVVGEASIDEAFYLDPHSLKALL